MVSVSLCLSAFHNQNQIRFMISNYFKTALRHLRKGRITSFINLFGLSVGMTAAIFIFIWVQNEISVNRYQPNKATVYRITSSIGVSKDETWVWENSPMRLGEFAKNEIPEIKALTRLVLNSWGGPVFKINDQLFTEKTSAYVDSNWMNIFEYEFVAGNKAAFNSDPFSIVLTESKAKKYFGDVNPVGKQMKADTLNYVVQGVVKDNPANSSFQFDIIMRNESRLGNPQVQKNDQSWGNFNYITFVQLNGSNVSGVVTGKLNAILDKNRKNNNAKASLVPLGDIYFEENLQSSSMPHGNKTATIVFAILGILLLKTACINYINLTTARASLRAKEIGVRKINGAGKMSLFVQFLTESLATCLISILVSIGLIKLLLPLFNSITEKSFVNPFTSVQVWVLLFAILVFTTLMNGIYPALLLSSFRPLNVFRGVSVLKLNDGFIRRGLVVFQFALTILMITGTIVIYRQLNFIQNSNPGYNISQIMSLQIPWRSFYNSRNEARKNMIQSMKNELQSQSSIEAVSTGGAEIMNVGNASSGNADWDGRDSLYNPTFAVMQVDTGFKRMFQLQMVAGDWFGTGKADEENYILNETAANTLGIPKPVVGQRFSWGGDTGRITGIVKDFHYKSMHEKIGPMVIMYNGGSDSYLFLKTKPGNIPKAIQSANAVWSKFLTDQPFTYNFLDDSFNKLYKSDLKTSRLILIFSIIVVIISSLGLFGLATFSAEQRTKEIGIRKVLGASVPQIARLLSKEFLLLVIIAFVIAAPVAGWLMNKWLEDFAYRINLGAGIFIFAGLISILIALLSVSVKAVQAAMENPVKSLRSE